jgi:hypothetical protein
VNLKKLKHWAGSNWHNIPGYRTNRRIVVFESDDWGSIRMPSRKTYEHLITQGIRVDKCAFSKFDALESESDLNALFEVLKSHKNGNGKHPIFTANTVIANPDFNKIRDSDFNNYYFELFTETYNHYPSHQNSFGLWSEGMIEGIFHPQLHGREHLNVNRWLKYLKAGSKETKIAFENEMFGISTTISTENRKSYMAALDFEDENELRQQKIILVEAQNLFKQIFGFESLSFIATNYIWSSKHEGTLFAGGTKYFQGARNQILPVGELSKSLFRKHYLGERNSLGQQYLVRNCFFEPATDENKDSLSECLKQIETAFRWKKPAIIGTHRLNYIGFINESNRKNSLKKLNELLGIILKKWPDVEFISSDSLGKLIETES